MSVVSDLTSGIEVTIETAVTPPFTYSLDGIGQGDSAASKMLKPKLTLKKNGQVVDSYAPYGEPGDSWIIFPIVTTLSIIFLLMWFRR